MVCGLATALAPACRPAAGPADAPAVVRRLDRPLAAPAPSPDVSRRAPRLRWSAAEVATGWARTGRGSSATFRSPELAIPAPDALHAVVVTLRAAAAADAAPLLLLWNDRPVIERPDELRYRRRLRARASAPTRVVIPVQELRGDPPRTPRYLFLHLPEATRLRETVDSVEVVTRAELLATAPERPTRALIAGELRDVFHAGASLSFALAGVPERTELLLGLHLPDAGVRAGAKVTFAVRGGGERVSQQDVRGGSWHDFYVPLPLAEVTGVALSVEPRPPAGAYWSVPLLVTAGSGPQRPNVVLYVVDCLRADRLGSYGSGLALTPELDDLARGGRLFRRAYAAASWTKPAVGSMLTSLYPQTHRLGGRYYADPLPESALTLQDVFRGNGYLTAQFTANVLAGPLSGLDQGFDRAFTPEAFLSAQAAAEGRKVGADQLNARIVPWLERHARLPFFLYVHSVDAHPPFVAPASTSAPGRATRTDPLAGYHSAIAFNDREIGRLRRALADLGLSRRTIVVVTADHGEAFGEHGQFGHGRSVHEEEVRVPLIVSWPGGLGASTVDQPVSLVDLMPTLLEYCSIGGGLEALQGRSAARENPSDGRLVFTTKFIYPDDPDALFSDRSEAHAVVDGPWKLISADSDGRRRLALFHVATDPQERQDRSGTEPEQVRRLAAALEAFLSEQARARVGYLAQHASAGDDIPERAPRAAPQLLQQLKSLGYVR